ncbi:MAG TPA: hypothetical protein VL354_04250 [Spirochaetia bacterium]|nr:hypothetical protein [Spirochaetia bacterium]
MMKRPVLRIKKGKDIYDDEENRSVGRDADDAPGPASTGGTPRPRGSLLRLRRGSLLPLLILAVIIAIVLRYVPLSTSRADIDGWHASLQAEVAGGTLEVGVGFSRLGSDRAAVNRKPQPVSVVFAVPDTGEQVGAFGALSDSRVALKARMHYTASVRTLRAIVRINGESRTLSLSIPGP